MLAISAFLLLFCNFSFHPDPCYFRYFAFTQMLAISAILVFTLMLVISTIILLFLISPRCLQFCYFAIFNPTQMLAISDILVFTLMLAILLFCYF